MPIDDGESGLLVDGADIDAIAAALRRLLGDRRLSRPFGRRRHSPCAGAWLGSVRTEIPWSDGLAVSRTANASPCRSRSRVLACLL